uniref:Uncharacterized protein n=2 Tax=Plectus sambesii TaxID=2011161 RepID=A0A914WM24_9BILA
MAEVGLPLAVILSTLLLVVGLAAALIDIESYGWGLYLILVAVVGFIIIAAFCLVGTEQQTQPTIAKQVWSTTRQTIRRYTPMLPRSPLAMAELDPAAATVKMDRHSSQSLMSSTTLSVAKVAGRPSDQTESQSPIEFDDGEDERGVHYV